MLQNSFLNKFHSGLIRALFFFITLSFSNPTQAFYAQGAQANCALPLYLAAMQGGLFNKEKNFGAEKAKLRNQEKLRRRQLEKSDEAIKELKREIGKLRDDIAERLDGDDSGVGDDVVDQVLDYMRKGSDYRDEYEFWCGDGDDYAMLDYDFEDKPQIKTSIATSFVEALKPPDTLVLYLKKLYTRLFSALKNKPLDVVTPSAEATVTPDQRNEILKNIRNKQSNTEIAIDDQGVAFSGAMETQRNRRACQASCQGENQNCVIQPDGTYKCMTQGAIRATRTSPTPRTTSPKATLVVEKSNSIPKGCEETCNNKQGYRCCNDICQRNETCDMLEVAQRTSSSGAPDGDGGPTTSGGDGAPPTAVADDAGGTPTPADDAGGDDAPPPLELKTDLTCPNTPCPAGQICVKGGSCQPQRTARVLANTGDNQQDPDCALWKQWGRCAGSEGEIKDKLCRNPSECAIKKTKRFDNWKEIKGTSLQSNSDRGGKRACNEALGALQELIKDLKKEEKKRHDIVSELEGIEETYEEIEEARLYGTEADNCDDCWERRLTRFKEIVDPAPSGWEVLGNVVGTVGAAAMGYYGIKEANKLRDQQGFAAQPGLAMGLAYPFIMKGLYGGGLFGSSSSLACSPTMYGGGNLFGNPFMYQMAQMQQMRMMGGMMGMSGMMPGMMGMSGMGGMMPGMMGGGMAGMMIGGMMPGMMGMGGMMPGMMGGGMAGMMIGGMMPGMMGMGGMMPGMMGGGMAMMGGMMPGMMGMGGMMPGMMGGGMAMMGGMMPGMMMAGGMQSYMQYQQALMSWRMSQMNNYMQRQQAVSGLQQEIWRLQAQIQQTLYGGSGNNFNFSGAGGGGDDDSDGSGVGAGGREREEDRKDQPINRGRIIRGI